MKKIIMLAAMITSVATLLCSCSLRGGKLRAELPCGPCPDCLMIDNCDISFGDGNMYFYTGDIVNNTSMINIANSEGKQTLIAEYDLSENEGLQNVLVSDGKIYALIFNDMSGRYYIGTVDEENRTVTPVVEPGVDMKEWNVRSGKIVYVISVFRDDNMERGNVFVYDIKSGETENVCTEGDAATVEKLNAAIEALTKAYKAGDEILNGSMKELGKSMESADKALQERQDAMQQEIDMLKSELQALKDQIAAQKQEDSEELQSVNAVAGDQETKIGSLKTLATVGACISSVSLLGNIALLAAFLLEKKKHFTLVR